MKQLDVEGVSITDSDKHAAFIEDNIFALLDSRGTYI